MSLRLRILAGWSAFEGSRLHAAAGSGVYVIRIQAGEFAKQRKMVLMR